MDITATAHTFPPIMAKKIGITFLDFDSGKYSNTFELKHNVNGQYERFGTMTESSEHPRLFCLGDNEYTTYADFVAAYYARYPERIAINTKV